MDYVTLCQTLRQECGAAGNGPASVTDQTGESLRFVNWIQQAYRKVQTSRTSWRWMHSTSTIALTTGQANYAKTALVASRFGRWDRRNWVSYPTADGVTSSTPMIEISYDEYERMYIHRPSENGVPVHFAIGPDDSVWIGPPPAAGYTLRFRYWKSADTLSGNADVPEIPEDFHMVIVYEAMKYYATREAAAEIMDSANERFDEEMHRLERDQLEILETWQETLA